MARGIIYHISVNPSNLGSMDESDFYDKLDELRIDYVQDHFGTEAEEDLEPLKKLLEKTGLAPSYSHKDASFGFYTGDDASLTTAKMEFFRNGLKELKDLVNGLELRDFATDSYIPYHIRNLCDSHDSDLVYLDMGTGPALYSLHAFIRGLRPHTVYFVAKDTVYMH